MSRWLHPTIVRAHPCRALRTKRQKRRDFLCCSSLIGGIVCAPTDLIGQNVSRHFFGGHSRTFFFCVIRQAGNSRQQQQQQLADVDGGPTDQLRRVFFYLTEQQQRDVPTYKSRPSTAISVRTRTDSSVPTTHDTDATRRDVVTIHTAHSMSEPRGRAAKRALAAEQTASPHSAVRAPTRRTRQTRRRIGSNEEATAENGAAATAADSSSGALEPESEDDTQKESSIKERKSETETGSSTASSPVRMTGFDAGAGTPDDAFSVISGDASPQGSVFDFLTFSNADPAPFSLFTPSPGFSKMTMASSPPTRRTASALSSPSRFFRSPFNVTGAKKKQTRRSAHRRHSAAENEEKSEARSSISSSQGSMMSESGGAHGDDGVFIKEEIIIDYNEEDFRLRTPARKTTSTSSAVKTEIPQMLDMMNLTCSESVLLSPWPRATLFANTPSPPSRVQLLSRRLKEDFDRERMAHDDTGDGDDVGSRSDTESSIDADDLYRSAPSGLIGEQDSFFSFANSLSPLVHAEEFASSFLSVRLSPLVSMESYELPRL